MNSIQLAASVAAASEVAQQEQLQQHGGQSPDWVTALKSPLPGNQIQTSQMTSQPATDDLMEIWRLLPNLRTLPEGLLRKLSPEAVFQLNNALSKDLKTAAKLSTNARLSQNARRVADNPIPLQAADDNRRDLLHPARFLGGATCPNVEMWLAARRRQRHNSPGLL